MESQGGAMSAQVKIKRTYSISQETVEMIERLAQETRRDLSTVVEIAVEEYARQYDNPDDLPG
jgi:predicted transcriptional regulator